MSKKRLNGLIEALGYKKNDVAGLLEVSPDYFYRLCSGSKPVSKTVLLAVECLLWRKQAEMMEDFLKTVKET